LKYHGGSRFGLPEEKQSYIYWLCRNLDRLPQRERGIIKGLIKEVGRKEALGRPILYATTDKFLEHFGISDIRELPPLPDPQPVEKVEEPLVP